MHASKVFLAAYIEQETRIIYVTICFKEIKAL